MDSELLFRFFEGLTTDSEDQTIKEWFDASPQNQEQFYQERKLFDALILHHDQSSITADSSILITTGGRSPEWNGWFG